ARHGAARGGRRPRAARPGAVSARRAPVGGRSRCGRPARAADRARVWTYPRRCDSRRRARDARGRPGTAAASREAGRRRTGAVRVMRTAYTLFRKDLLVEARTRESLTAMALFSVMAF